MSEQPRYRASTSAGGREGKRFAVIDTQNMQGGKGARRVSFHKTLKQAQAEAKRLNASQPATEAATRVRTKRLADGTELKIHLHGERRQ